MSSPRSRKRGMSSTEKTLAYSTAFMFITYIYMTFKSFQRLPPIPSLVDLKNINHLNTNDNNAETNTNTNSNPMDELPKETKFPQQINFAIKDKLKTAPEEFESIVHPAVELLPSLSEQIDNMIVPKFYNPPIFQKYGGIRKYLGDYGNRLMTLQEAKSIGSYITKTINQEDVLLETIYVAIASYRDFQCQQTIESILSRATHPERVRIAVVDQLDYTNDDVPCSRPEVPCTQNPNQILCKYKSQIDFLEMDASYAVGPVFARHLGHRMYRGEYFAIQCDAHVDFVKGWDVRIIKAWKSAKNEMAVLSTYLSDVNGAMDEEGNSLVKSRPVMCKSDYEGHGATKHLRHGQQPEGVTKIIGEPTIEPFWAAGFSFSRGHFVINVPYDQHLPWVFQGEEISIGLRGFTYGYDYYAPERSVCFHYYASQDKTGKRGKVNLFWEHSSIFNQNGNVVEKKGMERLNGILNMNPPHILDEEWLHVDEQFYGIGKVRTTKKFFDTFGIDTKAQKTQDHLCRFVGLNMQRKWKPYLRKDTMGINYDEITFKFKDPDIYGRKSW